MSRAEEQSLKNYPVIIKQGHVAKHDINLLTRRGFVKGYKQALQDLMADAIETTIDGKVVKVIVIDE